MQKSQRAGVDGCSKEGLEERLGSNKLWQTGWEKGVRKGTKERCRAAALMSIPRVCGVASLSTAQPESCPGVTAQGTMNSDRCYHHPQLFIQATDCALLSWERSGTEAAKRWWHEVLRQCQPLLISQRDHLCQQQGEEEVMAQTSV